jgi:hypothetical protein
MIENMISKLDKDLTKKQKIIAFIKKLNLNIYSQIIIASPSN